MMIKVELIDELTRFPRKATSGSAGVDFFAPKDVTFPPTGELVRIPLGVKLAMPRNVYVQLQGRSGLALSGLWVHPGVIDHDYRGEVSMLARNFSSRPITVKRRQGLIQGIVIPQLFVGWKLGPVEERETTRGAGGFGSTTNEVSQFFYGEKITREKFVRKNMS